MGFSYETNTSAVIQALLDYNTTTATVDLSSGLTTRISNDNIKLFDMEVGGYQSRNLPAVFVRAINSDEEFASMGETGPTGSHKFKTVVYHIFGVYRREGITSSHSDLLTETYRLAKNIEGIFQKELNLSDTALWCNPRRTEFTAPTPFGDGSWAKGVLVELEARYFFR